MTDIVAFELRETIAWIRMNDGKANALSPAMVSALSEALDRASAEARGVVIAGREGRFSAGFDLRVMMSGPDAMRALVRAGAEFLSRLYLHPQPVVVACTGHAIAAGALLLACADLRIGAEGEFQIGLSEIRKGLPVPIFAHALARDRLDPRQLTRSVLGAVMYDPRGAREAGWLDEVVAPDELEARAQEAVKALVALPSVPFAHTKRTLREATIEHMRSTLEAELVALGGG